MQVWLMVYYKIWFSSRLRENSNRVPHHELFNTDFVLLFKDEILTKFFQGTKMFELFNST